MEITSSPDLSDTVEMTVEAVGVGDSPREAQARAAEIDVWDQVEADRLWLRANVLPDCRGHVNLGLRVPEGMAIRGSAYEITVRDFAGDLRLGGSRINLSSVRGRIEIGNDIIGAVNAEDITGSISVEAVVAPVLISDSRADAEIRTAVGEVRVAGSSGRCSVTSQRGEITLEGVLTSRLRLESRSGSIAFSGSTLPGGDYVARTTDGDIAVALDEKSDCGLIVETDGGEIDWRFKARNTWTRDTEATKRRYANVRLGSGCFTAASKTGNISVTSA
jgi:DUF4097 and DUF4098 domain-containing protein YvlB